jgi:hypothetical protein
MKFISNIPDQQHVPFPIIAEEPHLKHIVRLLRPTDYLTIAGFGTLFPGALYLWEKNSPSIHPRKMKAVMMIKIPFFLSAGLCFVCQRSMYRFWGWAENQREVQLYKELQLEPAVKKPWSVVDW